MKLIFDNVPDEMAEKITENIKVALDEYKKKQIWPQKGDNYYYISARGIIYYVSYYDDACDKGRLNLGNCFKTQEEAEFKVEHLKVIHELEQLADDDQEWNEEMILHYAIHYNHAKNIIECEDWTVYQHHPNTYYFKSEESALAAIDKIGEDRLKKYYFGIKDEK